MIGPLLVAVALAQDPGPSTAACPLRDRWPDPDWHDASAAIAAERPGAVEAFTAHLFPPGVDRDDPERRGTRTDGAIVVHDGRILYEAYGPGFTADTRHLLWSVTKTLVQALAGTAVRAGTLALDDGICDHIDVGNPESCAISVEDLLTWTSGWAWVEAYEDSSPVHSSVVAMLYGEGAPDMVRFVTSHPLQAPPGTRYRYSSGDTTVLAAVVGAALSPIHGDRWPWAALFDPLGMDSVTFETDAAGAYVGGSSAWMPPRDMARFGLFLLRDGCWKGERLLPEGWLADSRRAVPAFLADPPPGDPLVPGRSLWLNTATDGRGDRPWPSAPEDTFAALGHWNQTIFVTPSLDLVVVRTADDRDGSFDEDEMLRLAIALIPEDPP